MVASDALTPLGAEDARILALETGPIRGHTLSLLLVEDSPGDAAVEALRAELTARLPAVPRWKQRLVPSSASDTGLAWQDDPTFDIARHVRRAGADRPLDDDELRQLTAEVMAVPLDRSRPLWTIDVVPRLSDGRWALLWKVHHTLADGLMKLRAGSRLLWTEEAPAPRGTRQKAEAKSPTKLAAGVRLATLASHRGLVIREFRRVWGLSPLATVVGPDRAVDFARCTLDELRAIGKAISPEATINDVLLAVIAGALRYWLEERHASGHVKVQVPVSMHPHLGDEDPFGNRDSFLFVMLPLDEPNPVARVRAVSKATKLRKNREDAKAIYAVRNVLVHAPAPVQRVLQHFVQGPRGYSLNVSNVPGPAGPIRILGRPVDALYPFAEIAPNHALRVSAASVNGTLFIGLCAEAHAIPDLDVLAAGIRLSVDELHDAVSRRGRARPPRIPAPAAAPEQHPHLP